MVQMAEKLLVDAIIGKGFASTEEADGMVKLGLAKFTGDGWNPDWSWKRKALEKLRFWELEEIYDG